MRRSRVKRGKGRWLMRGEGGEAGRQEKGAKKGSEWDRQRARRRKSEPLCPTSEVAAQLRSVILAVMCGSDCTPRPSRIQGQPFVALLPTFAEGHLHAVPCRSARGPLYLGDVATSTVFASLQRRQVGEVAR